MTAPVTWSPSAQAALDRLKGKLFATTTEASLILGFDIKGRTIRKAIATGDVPAVKAGSTYRVPVAWLLEQARMTDSTDDTLSALGGLCPRREEAALPRTASDSPITQCHDSRPVRHRCGPGVVG